MRRNRNRHIKGMMNGNGASCSVCALRDGEPVVAGDTRSAAFDFAPCEVPSEKTFLTLSPCLTHRRIGGDAND